MYRDKKIGIQALRELCSLPQRNEDIVGAHQPCFVSLLRIDPLGQQRRYLQRDNFLLLAFGTYRTWILPTMPRINHNKQIATRPTLCLLPSNLCRTRYRKGLMCWISQEQFQFVAIRS